MYNPRADGAKCDECPLNGNVVVPPNGPTNAKIVLIGEGPGRIEVETGRAFTGKSGQLLDEMLKDASVDRRHLFITNSSLCKPEKIGSTDDELALKKKSVECCKPRLEGELASINPKVIITMGELALWSLVGHRGSILRRRGGIHYWRETPIVPTLHPAFLLRDSMSYYGVVSRDIAKAKALADDEVELFKWNGSSDVKDLLILAERNTPLGIDIETTRDRPTRCELRSIAIADRSLAYSVKYPFTEDIDTTIREILKSSRPKIFHNAAFDVTVLRRLGYQITNPIIDTLILHHLSEVDVKHDLGFVAHDLLVVDPWKEQFKDTEDAVFNPRRKAFNEVGIRRKHLEVSERELEEAKSRLTGAESADDKQAIKAAKKSVRSAETKVRQSKKKCEESDTAIKELEGLEEDLLVYNRNDAQATAAIFPKLITKTNHVAKLRNVEHALLPVAIDMQVTGLPIGFKEREELHDRLLAQEEKYLEVIKPSVPSGWNPHSNSDRRYLLYNVCKIPATLLTKKSKTESTSIEAIIDYLDNELVHALFKYDEAHKLRNTFVDNLDIDKDGRIHPSWTVGAQSTGRWTSGDPNVQNWNQDVRSQIVAPEGRLFVSADSSQIEYRILAALSNCGALKEVFNKGLDAHSVVAEKIFGEQFTKESDPNVKKALRALGKKVVHASDYGAGAKTIVKGIRKDPKAEPFIRKTVKEEQIQFILNQFEQSYPEIVRWRRNQVRFVRENGYLKAEPLGRTRYFDRPNEVPVTICYNWPIQSAASDILNMSIINVVRGLREFTEAKLLVNGHDSLLVECNENEANSVLAMMIRGMERQFFGVYLKAEGKIGKQWSNV